MTLRGFTNTPRPPAPKELSAPERKLWKRMVDAFPSGWFRASDLPLLAELVRAHAMSTKLAARIAKCEEVAELKPLLELRDRECRRAASLATKLRLPPQSRSDRHVAGVAAKALSTPPWEKDPADEFFNDGPGRTQ